MLFSTGTEYAYRLFSQMNTMGSFFTPAKFNASWKSPVLLAPSPKYRRHVVVPFHLHSQINTGGHRKIGAERARVAEDPPAPNPLCNAESRPFERPVSFPNICAIISRGATPLIRNAPKSRCNGKI